jgi:hypothetical protein
MHPDCMLEGSDRSLIIQFPSIYSTMTYTRTAATLLLLASASAQGFNIRTLDSIVDVAALSDYPTPEPTVLATADDLSAYPTPEPTGVEGSVDEDESNITDPCEPCDPVEIEESVEESDDEPCDDPLDMPAYPTPSPSDNAADEESSAPVDEETETPTVAPIPQGDEEPVNAASHGRALPVMSAIAIVSVAISMMF